MKLLLGLVVTPAALVALYAPNAWGSAINAPVAVNCGNVNNAGGATVQVCDNPTGLARLAQATEINAPVAINCGNVNNAGGTTLQDCGQAIAAVRRAAIHAPVAINCGNVNNAGSAALQDCGEVLPARVITVPQPTPVVFAPVFVPTEQPQVVVHNNQQTEVRIVEHTVERIVERDHTPIYYIEREPAVLAAVHPTHIYHPMTASVPITAKTGPAHAAGLVSTLLGSGSLAFVLRKFW